MKTICVFTGSNHGSQPEYRLAAQALGRELVSRDLKLVYGGGNVGLMGVLADTVLEEGGHVTGVIPHALEAKELAHRGIQDLRVVSTMHERKALMNELSDGFVAMPGGLGTMEEFFEVITWAQLGLHRKPAALLNVSGYFDRLLSFLDQATEQKFVQKEHRGMLISAETSEELLDRLLEQQAPIVEKWIDRADL